MHSVWAVMRYREDGETSKVMYLFDNEPAAQEACSFENESAVSGTFYGLAVMTVRSQFREGGGS